MERTLINRRKKMKSGKSKIVIISLISIITLSILGFIIAPAFIAIFNTSSSGYFNQTLTDSEGIKLSGNNITGDYKSFIFYNSSSTLWNVSLSATRNYRENLTLQTRVASSYNLTDSGLVSFWSFNNDNSSTAIDEKGRFNATRQGVINDANDGNGTVGKGYLFDAVNDYLWGPANASVNPANAITVSVWVNVKGTGSTAGLGGIAGIWNAGYDMAYLLYQEGTTDVAWIIGTPAGTKQITAPITLNQWQNFIGTYNGSNTILYLNGVQASTDTHSGLLGNGGGTPAEPLYIGKWDSGASTYYFNGAIDEVRVYNRSLNASEALDLYQMGNSVFNNWTAWGATINSSTFSNCGNITAPTPVAHWTMNDNTTTKLIIDSMGAYNGTSSVNTNTIASAGKISTSLGFNLQRNNISSLDNWMGGKQNVTMAIWVKTTDTAAHDIEIMGSYYYDINGLVLYQNKAKVYFWNGASYAQVSGTTIINDGVWHHLAANYDGAYARLYVDGQEEGTAAALTGGLVTTSGFGVPGALNQGNTAHDDTYTLKGYLDDARLYNITLNATAIKALYNYGDGLENDVPSIASVCTVSLSDLTVTGKFLQFKTNLFSQIDQSLILLNYSVSQQSAAPAITFNNLSSENSFAISQFVKVNGTAFTLSGNNYTLMGADSYYLADYATNHTYDDAGNEINNSQIYVNEILDKAKALNINVIRTWGSMVGGNQTNPLGSDWYNNKSGGHYNLFLNGNITNYNETMFKGLDYVIYEASKRDIRLQIVLVNNWDTYGGMRWWVEQATQNYSGDGTDAYHDTFYNNSATMLAFQGYINYTLNRNNTYSGIVYKNDPAIFAWLLANEPRSVSTGLSHALIANWTKNMTAYIKSIDSNHLVGLGIEGFGYNETWGEGTDMLAAHNGTGVDFATFELHPSQWAYFAQRSENGTNGQWVNGTIAAGIPSAVLNRTLDWWSTGSGYTYNNRYTPSSANPAYIPYLAGRHKYQNWVSQNTNWSTNLLNMPVLLQELALPTNVSILADSQKARFFDQAINSFYSAGGDGLMMWNLNHDAYAAVVPGMDDGYSFYYSSDPTLKAKSKGVIDSYNFTMHNNTGGTSWVTKLDNYGITFNYNISLNGLTIVNSSLWVNVVNVSNQATGFYLDQINSTAVIEGANTFTRQFASTDNNLTWYVRICDSTNTCTNSSTNYLLLSNTPVITLTSPVDNSISNTISFKLNYTVSDGLGISHCDLYINGILNQTNLTTAVNVNQFFNFNVTLDNSYNWQIQCTDTGSNVGISSTNTFYYDTGIMNVTLISPANGLFSNTSAQNYTVNVTSTGHLATINWYLNGVLQDIYTVAGTVYSIIYAYTINLADGFYTWYYQAIDFVGVTQNSTVRNITIDTTFPLISFTNQTQNSGVNLSQSNIYMNTTWTETNFNSITFWVDGISASYSFPQYDYNKSGLSDGTHTYYVTLCDILNQCNSTETRTITLDTTNPNVTLLSPANNAQSTSINNFTTNLTDNTSLKNATLYIYNSANVLINQTYFNLSGTQQTKGIVVNLVDGVYNWFYQVFDLAGNSFSSNNNTLTIDTSIPPISLGASGWVTVYPNSTNTTTIVVPMNYLPVSVNGTNKTYPWPLNYIVPIQEDWAETLSPDNHQLGVFLFWLIIIGIFPAYLVIKYLYKVYIHN